MRTTFIRMWMAQLSPGVQPLAAVRAVVVLCTKGLSEKLYRLLLWACTHLRMVVECCCLLDCVGDIAGCVLVSGAAQPARAVAGVNYRGSTL